jgi:hypothetical protein
MYSMYFLYTFYKKSWTNLLIKIVAIFTHVHCGKSWRNISSASDISELFHEYSMKNISENFLHSISASVPKVLRIFPNSDIPLYMMKDSEIYREDCLLIQICLLRSVRPCVSFV